MALRGVGQESSGMFRIGRHFTLDTEKVRQGEVVSIVSREKLTFQSDVAEVMVEIDIDAVHDAINTEGVSVLS